VTEKEEGGRPVRIRWSSLGLEEIMLQREEKYIDFPSAHGLKRAKKGKSWLWEGGRKKPIDNPNYRALA